MRLDDDSTRSVDDLIVVHNLLPRRACSRHLRRTCIAVTDHSIRLGLFRYGHVVRGAVKGVRELAEIGDVVAVTSRPQNAVEDTLAWLLFMKLPLSGVHILSRGEKKSSVRPTCDVYIDDNVENCR